MCLWKFCGKKHSRIWNLCIWELSGRQVLQCFKWSIHGNNGHYGMLFHLCLSPRGICGKDYVVFEALNWFWVRPWWPIERVWNDIIQASLQSFMFKSYLGGWFEFGQWKMPLYHYEILVGARGLRPPWFMF